MSSNFGQIPPLTTELAALERLKNRCHHVISVDIDPIFFKLAGNKGMHNIMNEFEFRPDRTTDYGVTCPWASKKYPYRPYNGENGVSTFSLLFLIGSFWYFHVTRTSIKAWMSLTFWNEIWPWHIGLRWAIVALWASCFVTKGQVTPKSIVQSGWNSNLPEIYWLYGLSESFIKIRLKLSKLIIDYLFTLLWTRWIIHSLNLSGIFCLFRLSASLI